MVSGQRTLSILSRQLIDSTKFYLFDDDCGSSPSTVLTFVLKIPTLMNETLALPIHAFTSAPDPPRSSMMLPRYVKDFTSSRATATIVVFIRIC
ncbi:unnamed protein product [Schistosoma curassoni]|uniref:Uncharacterized protein n=1 Tax=Schistosoma curassoni TaxID=6186 RepID=A0A183JMV7_9TREM|nr:unnamed protein product [Schistosoma curassoni]